MAPLNKKKSAVRNMKKTSGEMSGLISWKWNYRKTKKYKEIKNFLRDLFWANKKNKIVDLSHFPDLEKNFLAKKKFNLSGG